MKPTYQGFQAQERKGYLELPPAGCYVAEIQQVKTELSYNKDRENVVCMIEITEGEYKGRYMEVYNSQKEQFGNVKYKGVFSLIPPIEGDEPWRQRAFESNLWCVEQSNPGYHWDWDEKKLKGKKIGINVRNRLYTYNEQDRSTTEIAKFETVDDVRNGRCKVAKDRDTRSKGDTGTSAGGGEPDELAFTDVSKEVEVPF